MTVALRFVGSGDAFGSGGRLQTCMHLSGGDGAVLIDCGTSSLIGMKRDGVDPGEVSAVLLSHLHVDHFGGVPFLILDAQFSRRTRPLLVDQPQQEVRKADDRASRLAANPHDRLRQTVVGAVRKGIAVDDEQGTCRNYRLG